MACECPSNKPMLEVDGSCVAEDDCAVQPSFIALLNQNLQELAGVNLEDGGGVDCQDQDKNCRHWTETIEGVCRRNAYVKENCLRSCRLCEGSPLTCSDVERMLDEGRQGFGKLIIPEIDENKVLDIETAPAFLIYFHFPSCYHFVSPALLPYRWYLCGL